MKKLFAILLVTALTSCGNENTIAQSPKSNTDYKNIIGEPIKMGDFEIAELDFPNEMRWPNAKTACEALGVGWRLPTKDELEIMYEDKDTIGTFGAYTYWSSTMYSDDNLWVLFFKNGYLTNNNNYDSKSHVRAVRTIAYELQALQEVPPPPYKLGYPISRIGSLLIAQNDLSNEMNWEDAKTACEALGDGWRLPTKDELNILFKNKRKIGGFAVGYYWSSTENYADAWKQFFHGSGTQTGGRKMSYSSVRAVRDF